MNNTDETIIQEEQEQPQQELIEKPQQPELPKRVQVEVEGKKVTIASDILTKAIERGIINIEKRDFRAKVEVRKTAAPPPDAFTQFTQIDETRIDSQGYPRELDVKGTNTPFDVYYACMVETASLFSELIDWNLMPVFDEENEIWELQEIDIAKMAVISKKWNNMGLWGAQSEKQIKALRAFAGVEQEDSIQRSAGFWGMIRRKKSPEHQPQPQRQYE